MYIQVMEKLVDIVHFLHVEIQEAFGSAGMCRKDWMEISDYSYDFV